MLPLLQAYEIRQAIIEYLKATYTFADKGKMTAFEELLTDSNEGMFKGPYLQMRLPFEKMEDRVALKSTIEICPPFDPYVHQYTSFQRLSTRNDNVPKPVILTTGTGSGKTESFLFPLLDHCWQQKEQRGIKAIILYPMNALATDQARRLAQEIYNYKDEAGNFSLRNTIRAGLFIGEGKKKGKRADRMGAEHIIEDRETLIKAPPDILLTNFKMLDFALMQARFHALWQHNLGNPSLLRFLVLDELHTYDGAKGSDVANLIRRLKLKLKIPHNYLVPIGTSATMSGGEEGKMQLVQFFEQVFGVSVDEGAVIEEQRLEPADFFEEVAFPVLDFTKLAEYAFSTSDDYNSYLAKQLAFWEYEGKPPAKLAAALKENQYLYELLRLLRGEVLPLTALVERWIERCGLTEELAWNEQMELFSSLLCLVTYAKEQSGKRLFPFLYVQLTYWLRSLTRVMMQVAKYPQFAWENDLLSGAYYQFLPPYFCRECGGSGWLGIKKEHSRHLENSPSQTRQQFIANQFNKNVYFISCIEDLTPLEVRQLFAADYHYTGDPIEGYLDANTLNIHDNKEDDDCVKIFGVRRVNGNRIEKICPHCNSYDTLALIGTGLPTLESIATAQSLTTSMADTLDRERKLLAFTNSVQDAAHQAGFIESRNYRFGMRQAIQNLLKQQDEPLRLQDFYKTFEQYWKNNTDPDAPDKLAAYFHKFLPPECESRIDIEEERGKDGKFKPSFIKEFSNRIAWEIWSEFTYNATIGRTLEKYGASGVAFDVEIMEAVFEQMQYWMRENTLGERIKKEDFLKFLNGFLHRIRIRGGVNHRYLRKFRTEKSNYWLITQNVNKQFFLMRNFGKHTRLPRFITLKKGSYTNVFDVLQSNGNYNWFGTYFLQCFEWVGTENKILINEFYQQLVEYLDANRLLDKKVASGVTNYGISPDQIYLSTNTQSFKCRTCEHELHVGIDNTEITDGMTCLQNRCAGKYEPFTKLDGEYYRMVYNRGKSVRIFAKDHTGLIERDKREKIEIDFKTRPSYDSTNVLVATSTLEMGIDIGDLNVTFNASMPPETANYLQRVGRAGRSSGTSLILNLAGRDEHDLYYFQEPLNMMDGQVKTPACYLEAKDILKRHFMAYCFDNWASAEPNEHKIPVTVKFLGLKGVPIGDPRFIFNRIADYIKKNQFTFFDQFKAQYEEWLDDTTSLDELSEELHNNTFVKRLQTIQGVLLTEITYYQNKRKEVDKALKGLPASGPQTDILKREKKALNAAIRNITGRNTIEYLTNIGLLPNYAFPETGVSINALITKKKEVNGQTEYLPEELGEIVRPASTALTELAPANIFYTQGHKLESQGLEILSQDEYQVYRFCSNCAEMALNVDIDSKELNCPTCGDASWASINNRKTLVELRTVISYNDKEQSRINDSSEERIRKFYQRSIHIQTEQNHSKGAWVLKQVPFGIEFFTKAKYVAINTGIREDGFAGARTIEINGTKVPEVGFVICKKCGKTTERTLRPIEIERRHRSYHFPYCVNRMHQYQGFKDDYFEEIYVYRSFYTEALKVLLPIQDFRTEEKIALFKAGLYLGLKHYYQGRPDHVKIQDYLEYNPIKRRKERYLVLYEIIPGGTGYLSRLFNKEEFNKLLVAAYEKIKECACQLEIKDNNPKDGCYHCIYTYGNQYERSILSRKEAEELFEDLIEKSNEWKRVDSLKGLEGFANLEESQLEHNFIDLLAQKAKQNPQWEFSELIENKIKQYRLTIAHQKDKITYRIIPQNANAYLQGVTLRTRPDAVLKCTAIKRGNQDAKQQEIAEVKAIALFLDGYKYHATKDYRRLPGDIQKRNAIIDTEQYHVWTLTWDDLEHAKENKTDATGSIINEQWLKNLHQKHPFFAKHSNQSLQYNNNFNRLTQLLISPLQTWTEENWSKLLLFTCTKELFSHCFSEEMVTQFTLTHQIDKTQSVAKKPDLFALSDAISFSTEMGIQLFIHPQTFTLKGFGYYDETLDNWEKDNWQSFWEIYNLTQFSTIKPLSKEAIADLQTPETVLEEILENFDPALHSIVQQLYEAGISFNQEFDFDLMENGGTIANAALGSEEKKFVIEPYGADAVALFKERGYTIIDPNKFNLNQL
jgi:DEAD/DEAH box helicase domain-containing protein